MISDFAICVLGQCDGDGSTDAFRGSGVQNDEQYLVGGHPVHCAVKGSSGVKAFVENDKHTIAKVQYNDQSQSDRVH